MWWRGVRALHSTWHGVCMKETSSKGCPQQSVYALTGTAVFFHLDNAGDSPCGVQIAEKELRTVRHTPLRRPVSISSIDWPILARGELDLTNN